MALTTYQTLSLVGVLVIILAVMLYNNAAARRTGAARGPDEEPKSTSTVLLSRFAHHQGNVVGETVAVEDDRLILKKEGVFKAVPLDMATLQGDEVVLQGYIDWDAAQKDGQVWLSAHRKGHDTVVTEQLTRSEDVQAPALEAWKERQAERGEADPSRGREEAGAPPADDLATDDSEE